MNNLERRLREQRTIEAIRKNFMGFNGKLASIAKILGSPIRDDFSSIDSSFYDGTPELWDEPENVMPIADMDEGVQTIGHVFDGLSRGYHIEIVTNRENNKITVSHKGYPVYVEVNGNLDSYAPYNDWETLIDYLYKQAQNRAKEKGLALREEKEQMDTNEKESFLKKLRMRWGI